MRSRRPRLTVFKAIPLILGEYILPWSWGAPDRQGSPRATSPAHVTLVHLRLWTGWSFGLSLRITLAVRGQLSFRHVSLEILAFWVKRWLLTWRARLGLKITWRLPVRTSTSYNIIFIFSWTSPTLLWRRAATPV